ncbi:hypothetical protein LIER_09430 [Lithospermum erythrorhizon]|uniref:Uncharacterized protein n=1 Tax=Lithospermum erythrorhizon TaxID=34254 RepID=A0AAV3PFJ6_LITER
MPLKKRLDYGFGGYQSPTIPKGPRSVRRRRSCKRLGEDSQICAFELLAAVAGKLLQESESSASSNAEGRGPFDIHRDDVKCEQFEGDKAFGSKVLDRGSCIGSAFTQDPAQADSSKSTVEETLDTRIDSVLDPMSLVTDPDVTKDVNLDLKLEICTSNRASRDIFDNVKGRSDDESLCDGKINNGADGQVDNGKKLAGDFIAANLGCINNQIKNRVNKNVLRNSGSSVQLKVPFYRNPVSCASFAKHRNNVKLGIVRDDDEKSFRCNSSKIKAYRPQSRLGYKRIRKILTSKYWKAGPKLKDSEFSYSYDGMKPFYQSRKSLSPRERYLRDTHSKRRKLCDHSFVVPFGQEASSESISNSPEKGVKGGNNGSATISHRGVQRSPSGKGLQKSRASNVKLSIKSFKVPELYIEVPETATVGALKRTVMEAVTAILRDGLRVGVVLQGKKVRDDNRTLQQAGLSERSNLDTLGFTLEPSFNQVPPVSPKKPSTLGLLGDERRLTRSPVTPILELALPTPGIPKDPPVVQLEKPVEEKVELGLSPSIAADSFTAPAVANSKALVPITSMNAVALSPIPSNQKSKRSELSHRRIRRPFSVGEVEALVEAVETLGTGRWRDVKIRSFDNADHRTYVDLKDKWKTLVHTASISPQQRRGEPVPQELLDRVLCAHTYWLQHQFKQSGKHHIDSQRILEGQVERVGA